MKSFRSSLLWAFVFAVIALKIWFNPPAKMAVDKPMSLEIVDVPKPIKYPKPKIPIEQKMMDKKINEKTVLELIPSAESQIEQVKKNPHQSPVSLGIFSVNLAERVNSALTQGADQKEKVFTELKDCVQNSDSNDDAVKALCLSKAKFMSESDLDFKSLYEALLKSATPEVVGIAKSL